jgi:hypothetical protein
VKITDRIPPFKRAKSLWSTRPRRSEELAILAGTAAKRAVQPLGRTPSELKPVETKAFMHGISTYFRNTQRMREKLTRFTTTPDWEARRALGASAHELLK